MAGSHLVLKDPMIQLYNGQKFQNGKNCFYSAVANLFQLYGFERPELDYYFLSDGLICDFYQDGSEDWGKSAKFPPYHCLFHKLTDWFGCTATVGVAETLRGNLEPALRQGHPVLLCMKPSYLDYHTVRIDLEYVHFIVITGLDLNYNYVHIVDSFVLDSSGTVHQMISWYDLDQLTSGCIMFAHLNQRPARSVDSVEIRKQMCTSLQNFLKTDTGGNAVLLKSFGQLQDDLANNRNLTRNLDIIMYLKTRFFCLFDYLADYLAIIHNPVYQNTLTELHGQWLALCVMIMMAYYRNEYQYVITTITEICSHIRLQETVICHILHDISRDISESRKT